MNTNSFRVYFFFNLHVCKYGHAFKGELTMQNIILFFSWMLILILTVAIMLLVSTSLIPYWVLLFLVPIVLLLLAETLFDLD